MELPTRIGARDLVEQRLELGLVLECVDAEEARRLVVVGLQLVIAERPAEHAVVGVRFELHGAEAEQRRAIPLGLAANVVELAGDEIVPLAVEPDHVVLEHAVYEDLSDLER